MERLATGADIDDPVEARQRLTEGGHFIKFEDGQPMLKTNDWLINYTATLVFEAHSIPSEPL